MLSRMRSGCFSCWKQGAGSRTNERLSVTCITCLEWNLTFCSFCCWTSWRSHGGQRSKLWEIESGHQRVNTRERGRESEREQERDRERNSDLWLFFSKNVNNNFHFPTDSLFVSLSLLSLHFLLPQWPSQAPATPLPWLGGPRPAAAALEWPPCLFCFVSSTSSSAPSSCSTSSPYFWVLWIWRSHKNGNTKLSAITAMHRLWNPRRPLS